VLAVDTNVLVHAHREESPFHQRARSWIERLAKDPTPWAVPVFCLGEFVRVVTHPRIFDPPSTIDQAVGAIEALVASPSLRVLEPQERFVALLAAALREGDARGNVAFDAQIVALLREHGVERLLTEDRDFSRFRALDVVRLDASVERS
jgi:hypothetical protein